MLIRAPGKRSSKKQKKIARAAPTSASLPKPRIAFMFMLLHKIPFLLSRDEQLPHGDENQVHVCAGRVKVNLEPFPSSLSTQILPPCISTNLRVSASPSPVPSRGTASLLS